MKIKDFQEFIRNFPYKNQSFDIKSKNWKVKSQQKLIDTVFDGKDTITLNRYDLINSSFNTKEFIIKTLMWGYPTKGRGRNIENMLKDENFNQLTKVLDNYKENEITIEQLKKDIKSIQGLGLSTITKFTHFLNTSINGHKAVILDIQIIEAINTRRFDELNELVGISYENAPNKYSKYIKIISNLSKFLNAEPDQVEMFLFTFGRTLSELQGENCYDFD